MPMREFGSDSGRFSLPKTRLPTSGPCRVAELSLGLVLSLLRRISELDRRGESNTSAPSRMRRYLIMGTLSRSSDG